MPLKVLIVDDDRASLELMTEVFSSVDILPCPVNDSRRAAALVESEKFDGIFLELQMPGLHGLDLTHRIRQSPWNRSTPVVVVTGWDERTAMKQVFDRGATFFLRKPLDRQRLLRLFRTASGSMIHNRRCFVRVPLRTEVVCETSKGRSTVMSCNLSQGGMLLEPSGLRLEDHVRLSFSLPGSSIGIRAVGAVVRMNDDLSAGVQFVGMNHEGRDGIREALDKLISA
jgi:CheY-like chemotaxis protein